VNVRVSSKPPESSEYFALRLSAFYATVGTATGFAMPFFPVWLEYKGLDPGQIGIVLATPMVVRIIFVPLATRLADRFNALRGAIFIAALGSVVGHAVLGMTTGFWDIAAALALTAIFFTPTYPLLDAYALRGLTERGRSYGPVRLWSSTAFVLANVAGGFLIGILTRAGVIWLLVAAYGVGALLAWLMVPVKVHVGSQASRPSAKLLWQSPAFVAIVVASSFIQASHAVYYGFSTISWNGKGLDDTTIGALWALGTCAEIALFALSGKLPGFITPGVLVPVGAAGALLRWIVMAFDPPFAMLPFLQCLHALSFGATHIGTMLFLARVAPPGLGATAQGDLTATQAVVFAGAMGASGVLFRAYGDLAYGAMGLLAGIGLVVALAASLLERSAAQR
jgi:PPP family 3-phenylpropionic acid transporter